MTPPPTAVAKGGARPQVSPRKHDVEGIERVYVWDLLVRMTHWLIVLATFILAITGIYIGKPFLIPEGAQEQQFVMATMKVVQRRTRPQLNPARHPACWGDGGSGQTFPGMGLGAGGGLDGLVATARTHQILPDG